MATYKTKHDRTKPKKETSIKTAIQSKPPEGVAEVESFSLLWMARKRAVELGKCFVCEIVLKNKIDESRPLFRFFVSKSIRNISSEREYFERCGVLVNWKMVRCREFGMR